LLVIRGSVLALEDIRRISPVPVVGTVPAVKPAAEISSGRIGILATERTVNSLYLDYRCVKKYANNSKVIKAAAGDIYVMWKKLLFTTMAKVLMIF